MHSARTARAAIAAIAAIAAVACVFTTEVTASGENSSATTTVTSTTPAESPEVLNEDELLDLREAAHTFGITETEAVDRFGWQNLFAIAATRIEEKYPEDIADSGMDGDRSTSPWISFKGEAPEDVHEFFIDIPVSVGIRQNLGWSKQELVRHGQDLHYAVLESEGIANVNTDIDTSTGTVDVQVQPDGELPYSLEGAPARGLIQDEPRVRTQIKEMPHEIQSSVTLVNKLYNSKEVAYSGGRLSTCTSAFSVKNSSFANGLLTAGHCPPPQTYEGRAILTRRAVHNGSKGDYSWYSSSETTNPHFYYTKGAIRPLKATANATEGMSLCLYGKTSSNVCDKVYKTNQFAGDTCNLIMMQNHYSDNGDSGGPWFWGNTGYGIHRGSKTYLLKKRSVFTPARSTAANLGITVKLFK